MYKEIIEELKILSESDFAKWLKPFLSISGSDEILLGVRVPKLRKLAKKYKDLPVSCIEKLLQSKYHEARELALFVMLLRCKKEPKIMCDIYLNNLLYINNWDLVDYTAPHIIAPNVEISTLRKLADSDYLWANRVAMVSTIYFIKQGDFSLALEFAQKYVYHQHHLMHKAAGWMLREIGKKDLEVLKSFLKIYFSQMPSVMRSYAREHLRNKT